MNCFVSAHKIGIWGAGNGAMVSAFACHRYHRLSEEGEAAHYTHASRYTHAESLYTRTVTDRETMVSVRIVLYGP